MGEEKLSCNQEVFPVNCIKEPHGGKGTENSKYFSIGEDFLSHSKYIFTFKSNFYICNFMFFVLKRIPFSLSYLLACLNNRSQFYLFCRTFCPNYLLIFRMKMSGDIKPTLFLVVGGMTRYRDTFQKRKKNKLGEIDIYLIF